MTDSTGAIVQTLDYFPFGGIRIDNKVGTFDEQRKYIGQEYDADTSLNYLNARYYNSAIGGFISEDPMFWSFDKEYLADPQQWNSYSYARNNPIVGSDPSGEKPYFSPGFAHPFKSRDTANSPGIPEAMSWIENQVGRAEFFSWSQRDNEKTFRKAGQALAEKAMSENSKTDPIDLFSHSDGGQPSGIAAEILVKNGYNIRNVVFAGMPVREKEFDLTGVQNVVMSYNTDDFVQTKGGNMFSASGLFGLLSGSPMGGIIGSILGWGEFGPAGRKLPGANNVNMTKIINDHPGKGAFYEHNDTFYSQAVRDEISKHLKK